MIERTPSGRSPARDTVSDPDACVDPARVVDPTPFSDPAPFADLEFDLDGVDSFPSLREELAGTLFAHLSEEEIRGFIRRPSRAQGRLSNTARKKASFSRGLRPPRPIPLGRSLFEHLDIDVQPKRIVPADETDGSDNSEGSDNSPTCERNGSFSSAVNEIPGLASESNPEAATETVFVSEASDTEYAAPATIPGTLAELLILLTIEGDLLERLLGLRPQFEHVPAAPLTVEL